MIKDAIKRMEALHASGPLRNALKEQFTKVQSTVDSVTNEIYSQVQAPFEAYVRRLAEPESYYGARVLCGVLVPAVIVRAEDVAPAYSVEIDHVWHLNVLLEEIDDHRGIGGRKSLYSVFPRPGEDDDLELAIERVRMDGANLVLSPPSFRKMNLVVDYIEKHNMVQRFSILATSAET